MKIYTKTGDRGDTSLHGGQRIPKDALRVEAYGTVDELNAVLGMVLAGSPEAEFAGVLLEVQHTLFALGADLATPRSEGRKDVRRIDRNDTQVLEHFIDSIDSRLPELTGFILPGGSTAGACLHFARTVCRRAERCVVRLSHSEDIGDSVTPFLNRLSDLLFVLARSVNKGARHPEVRWNS